MSIPETELDQSRTRDLSKDFPIDNQIAPQSCLLQPWGPNIWLYARMVVIALQDEGGSLVWNPSCCTWTQELQDEIAARCGRIRHMILVLDSNQQHNDTNSLVDWAQNNPQSKIYVPPGDTQNIDERVVIDFILSDDPNRAYVADVDQVMFRGGLVEEAAFFHKMSSTILFGGSMLRHAPGTESGALWFGNAEEHYYTPLPMQLSYWWNGSYEQARTATEKILNFWKPKNLLLADGHQRHEGDATKVLGETFAWVPKKKPERQTDVVEEKLLNRMSFTTSAPNAIQRDER